jgi:thimet oligopeptidase
LGEDQEKGYSSNYSTYSLSKVIALDFFNQFDKKNLLDGPAGMRYRRTVMEPGWFSVGE